jgi:hypothetical protein
MESEANKSLTVQSSPDDVILSPHFDKDVLRHIALFLDFQSLRQFRLVSREWNAACLPILMKRGHYNLSHPCDDNDKRADLYRGAINYSSWKISHSVYESAELLHDNEMWENVRSLSIHQFRPLTREFHRWAWETIGETRCPNLQELTFSFENVDVCDDDSPYVNTEIESDYGQAIQGLPNASFPNISNLSNLTSVHFKGICDKTTAYFAQHLLAASTPSLRHLYFCPIGESDDVYMDRGEAFRIFDYLKQKPCLLSNLQSFGFNLGGRYSATRNDDNLFLLCDFFNESSFTKCMKRNASLPFGFSGQLESLFWDSPFHLDGQLLPGVLSPSVASSLVQLSLRCRAESLEKGADNSKNKMKMSFRTSPGFGH